MTNTIIIYGLNALFAECYGRSYDAGWWNDPITGESLIPRLGDNNSLLARNFPHIVATKIALIHSEISEALEGYRSDKMDDKLPDRKAIEVELADAIIRIGDLAGALRLDIGAALEEKLVYNANRADHKLNNRTGPGGKKF